MRRIVRFTAATVMASLAASALIMSVGCRRIEQRDPAGVITVDTVAGWWSNYARDLREGDAATVARWFSDSALLMEPTLDEVAGRAAIEQVMRAGMAQYVVDDVRIRPREIAAMGARLFEWGTFQERYRPRAGEPVERRGRYMAEWRRPRGEGEQAWRIHRLMLSEGLPADSAQAPTP